MTRAEQAMKALVLLVLRGLLPILRLLPQKPVQALPPEPRLLQPDKPNAITRHLEKHQRILDAYDRLDKRLINRRSHSRSCNPP